MKEQTVTREKVERILRQLRGGVVLLATPEILESVALLCEWALNRDTAASAAQGRCIEAERELASAQNALCEIRETVEAFQKGQVRTITETDGASQG